MEREWASRVRAHEHLHAQLREEGASRDAAQYALTAGHFTRGVIACGTDRAIRMIDWMLTQRGRAPQAAELRVLGQELYRHLGERGAPARVRRRIPRLRNAPQSAGRPPEPTKIDRVTDRCARAPNRRRYAWRQSTSPTNPPPGEKPAQQIGPDKTARNTRGDNAMNETREITAAD